MIHNPKIGDIVRLLPNKYTDSQDNPEYGGKYGKIQGTIIQTPKSPTERIFVRWQNNKTNNYCPQDLEKAFDTPIKKTTNIINNPIKCQ